MCLSARTQHLDLVDIHLGKLVQKENLEFVIASDQGGAGQTVDVSSHLLLP